MLTICCGDTAALVGSLLGTRIPERGDHFLVGAASGRSSGGGHLLFQLLKGGGGKLVASQSSGVEGLHFDSQVGGHEAGGGRAATFSAHGALGTALVRGAVAA